VTGRRGTGDDPWFSSYHECVPVVLAHEQCKKDAGAFFMWHGLGLPDDGTGECYCMRHDKFHAILYYPTMEIGAYFNTVNTRSSVHRLTASVDPGQVVAGLAVAEASEKRTQSWDDWIALSQMDTRGQYVTGRGTPSDPWFSSYEACVPALLAHHLCQKGEGAFFMWHGLRLPGDGTGECYCVKKDSTIVIGDFTERGVENTRSSVHQLTFIGDCYDEGDAVSMPSSAWLQGNDGKLFSSGPT